MEKQELLKLREIVLDQKREKSKLEKNAKFFYKKIWAGLIEEFRNDIYGQKSEYQVFLNYDIKNQIMENITMPVVDMDGGVWIKSFAKSLKLSQKDLVSLLASDGLEIVSKKSKDEHNYDGYINISKEDLIKFAFDSEKHNYK